MTRHWLAILSVAAGVGCQAPPPEPTCVGSRLPEMAEDLEQAEPDASSTPDAAHPADTDAPQPIVPPTPDDRARLKPPAPDPALQAMARVPADFDLRLERAFHSGNRAMMEGPSYSLHVNAGGTVTVKAYGKTHRGVASKPALVGTLNRLGDLGFFAYPDQPLDDPTCSRMHTIDEDITVELRVDGRHRRLVYNRKCFTPATAAIVQFANAVQTGWVDSAWIDPKLGRPANVEELE